jgi:hypothetical protein
MPKPDLHSSLLKAAVAERKNSENIRKKKIAHPLRFLTDGGLNKKRRKIFDPCKTFVLRKKMFN